MRHAAAVVAVAACVRSVRRDNGSDGPRQQRDGAACGRHRQLRQRHAVPASHTVPTSH